MTLFVSHRTAVASALLATLTVLGTAPVHAASATASASIHDLSFTLIDLDTTDGIAAGITFTDPLGYGHSAYGLAFASQSSGGVGLSDGNYFISPASSTQFITAGGTTATAGGSTASASSTTSSFSATASSNGGDAKAATFPNNYYYGYKAFTLSANTLLVVQGKYDVSASVDATGSTDDNAQAHARLYGSFTSGAGLSQSAIVQKGVYVYGGGPGNLQSDALSGSFAFAFKNDALTDGTGSFSDSYAFSYANVATASSVPEAETLALALAGLGVTAGQLLARRRKQA